MNNDSRIIREYFRVLKKAIDAPQNIYNMDEKGFLLGLIQQSYCQSSGVDGNQDNEKETQRI